VNVTATLIGQLLTFAVLIWFIKAFLWEPILNALEDRKKRIAEGLAAAERGMHEQELAQQRAKEELHEAKKQAAEIRAAACRGGRDRPCRRREDSGTRDRCQRAQESARRTRRPDLGKRPCQKSPPLHAPMPAPSTSWPKSFDKWSEVLAFLAATVRDEQMQQLLNSPRLTDEQKAEAMIKVAGDLADDQVRGRGPDRGRGRLGPAALRGRPEGPGRIAEEAPRQGGQAGRQGRRVTPGRCRDPGR